MTNLYDFPSRFNKVAGVALGSIDEIAPIAADDGAIELDALPAGAGLYVRGWAANIDRNGPAPVVVLRVDNDATYEARVELPRPDVARLFENDAFERCGFEGIIPTGRLKPGAHKIGAFVLDPSARNYARLESAPAFSIAARTSALPDRPFAERATAGSFDKIVNETRGGELVVMHGCATVPRGDRLHISGWICAAEPAEAFAELYAVVDDANAVAANYGASRPDVAVDFGSPAAEFVGFDVAVPTIDLDRGEHVIEIVGKLGDALVTTSLALRLTVGEPLPARVPLQETTAAFIDEVVRLDGASFGNTTAPLRLVRGDRVFVRGWAFDQAAQSLAAGVVFVIDNEREVVALYGLSRPDIAQAFANDGLARTGYSCEFGTDDLAAGIHTAVCRVLARDGRGALMTTQQFSFDVAESR